MPRAQETTDLRAPWHTLSWRKKHITSLIQGYCTIPIGKINTFLWVEFGFDIDMLQRAVIKPCRLFTGILINPTNTERSLNPPEPWRYLNRTPFTP